jgi:hypothetical protein
MSIKLKALGLGLIAMLAMGAFSVMNAGATSSGHFTVGSHSTIIKGEEGDHELHFRPENGTDNERIGCDVANYTGEHNTPVGKDTTTTELTITPAWSECYTTGSPTSKFQVDEGDCDLLFTSRALPEANDATVHVKCVTSPGILITHGSTCTIRVPPQTVGGAAGNGVTYTTKTEANGTHWITLDVKVKVTSHYEAGFCVLLGTGHTSTMEGSVTVKGFDKATGNQVSITAT